MTRRENEHELPVSAVTLVSDVGTSQALNSSPDADLGGQVRRGLGWSVVNTLLSRVFSLAAGIVLARILVPEDYGVYAVALVVLSALLSVNELGVSLAIVRWPRSVESIAPTVSTLSLGFSVLLYVVCYALAPLIGSALQASTATTMIRVLSLCILVDAVAAVPAALITRAFQQRRRLVIDLVGLLLGTGLSVVMALEGFGAWALIWGFIASNVVVGVLSIVLAPRWFGFGFDPAAAKQLLLFGSPLAGASLVLFVMMNLDYVVVGRALGTTALGFYMLAFTVCSWPVNMVSAAFRRVSLAGFSRAAERTDLAGPAFIRAASVLVLLALPMCVGLGAFSVPLIGAFYGQKWLDAAPALRFLCVLAVARVMLELVYDYLVAINRNRANLALQLTWLVALVPALVAGARLDGIRGVAAAHAVVSICVLAPVALLVLRASGVSPRALLHACRRPVLAALVMGGVAVGALRVLEGYWMQLLVGGTVSALVYAGVVLPSLLRLRATLIGAATSRS